MGSRDDNGMRLSRGVFLLLLLLALASPLMIVGCGGPSFLPAASLRDPSVDMAWPPAPNPARIRFLREISGPEQVKAEPGAIARFLEFVTGEQFKHVPFVTPYGVVSDGGTLLFVSDSSSGVVHRIDLARQKVSYIVRAGDEFLSSPVGLALSPSGDLYVSDSVNAKVYVFSRDGEFLRVLADGQVDFKRPAGLAVNSKGVLFVVDVLAHKLKVFNVSGRFLGDFPPDDIGGKLNLPSHVAVDKDDKVYVTDALNFTVKVYDSAGRYLRSIGEIGDAPGSFARPRGVAVDSDLNVYVIDAAFDNFQIFNQEGQLLLFVGKPGKKSGEFYMPSGIHIDRNDRIFISDSYNRRVQVFEYLKEENR